MDKNKKSSFAEKLINLRKAKGMTQGQIAEALGIKRSTYAYYECTTTPPMDTLRKLANLFNTTVDEIVDNKPTHYAYKRDNRGDIIIFNQPNTTYNSEPIGEKLTADERILLTRYQALTPEEKSQVQEYLRNCMNDTKE